MIEKFACKKGRLEFGVFRNSEPCLQTFMYSERAQKERKRNVHEVIRDHRGEKRRESKKKRKGREEKEEEEEDTKKNKQRERAIS